MQESQEIQGFLPWTQLEDRDKPQSVLWGSEDGAVPSGDISMDTSTCVGRERIRTHVRFLSSGEQRWEREALHSNQAGNSIQGSLQ